MSIGIYKIISPSGRIYIGQSWDIEGRKRAHRNSTHNLLLNKSIKKYGFNNHEFNIIHELPKDVEQSILNTYEIFYIAQYKECGFKMLNLNDGGRGGRQPAHIIEKAIAKLRGRKMSEEQKKKISIANKGKIKSHEHCKKISDTKTGVPMREDVRLRMIKTLTGRPSKLKGRKLSDERREQIRVACTGRKHSDESKLRISLGNIEAHKRRKK